MKTPQVVIDTNVLIAAQRSQRGASSKLMSLVGMGRFDIHVSVPLVLEYEEVLLRQRLELRLTQADVANIVDALCGPCHATRNLLSVETIFTRQKGRTDP